MKEIIEVSMSSIKNLSLLIEYFSEFFHNIELLFFESVAMGSLNFSEILV